jgi:membrane-associated phospholipid phosphatase
MSTSKNNRIMTIFKDIFKVEAIVNGPIFLFPKFNEGFFYFTTLLSLSFTVLMSPFASSINKEFIEKLVGEDFIAQVEHFFTLTFMDPLIIQIITAVLLSIIIFSITENTPNKHITNKYSLLFPWILLLLAYILVELIFKPSFGYLRPEGYSIEKEAFFVKFFHQLFGQGQSAPSGFVVRQLCLVILAFLLISHKDFPWSKFPFIKFLFGIFFSTTIILIAIERIVVEAHTVFDIIFAVGCGSIIFWLIYVIPYDIFHRNGTLNKVFTVFFLTVGVFIFYSQNPIRWLITALGLTLFLLLLDFLPIFQHSFLNKPK